MPIPPASPAIIEHFNCWMRTTRLPIFREALATAAHELKTPLGIMDGYLHLLLAQKLGPLTHKQVEVLTEMQENGAAPLQLRAESAGLRLHEGRSLRDAV